MCYPHCQNWIQSRRSSRSSAVVLRVGVSSSLWTSLMPSLNSRTPLPSPFINSGIFLAPKKTRITRPISSNSCIPSPINKNIVFISGCLNTNKSYLKIIWRVYSALPEGFLPVGKVNLQLLAHYFVFQEINEAVRAFHADFIQETECEAANALEARHGAVEQVVVLFFGQKR